MSTINFILCLWLAGFFAAMPYSKYWEKITQHGVNHHYYRLCHSVADLLVDSTLWFVETIFMLAWLTIMLLTGIVVLTLILYRRVTCLPPKNRQK